MIMIPFFSPKPNVPPPKAYDPPSPPSAKDLGPPPPGYGRYTDLDRGLGGGPPGGGSGGTLTGPPRRNLDEVLCFKVNNCSFNFSIAPF
jgi:cleavage and polyadenylation specificity factor subunit 4